MQEILFKISYFERGLTKTLNQKGLGTSDQSLFRLQHKFTKISLLVIYFQAKFDGVI